MTSGRKLKILTDLLKNLKKKRSKFLKKLKIYYKNAKCLLKHL